MSSSEQGVVLEGGPERAADAALLPQMLKAYRGHEVGAADGGVFLEFASVLHAAMWARNCEVEEKVYLARPVRLDEPVRLTLYV